MSEKLKPCPFCGGTKICTEKGINLNYCDNCSAESNVEHWNTRPIEDELRAENVRLNSWLDEVIKQGNYLEHTLRLAYEHVNGHAFVHGWRDMVNHIQNESPTDQLTAHSDIERQDDKSSNDTQTSTIVYGKESE